MSKHKAKTGGGYTTVSKMGGGHATAPLGLATGKPVTPPVTGTLAGDPSLLAAQDQAIRDNGLAQQQNAFTVGQLQSAYGFSPDGTVDPNNPYSRAALLADSYKRSRAGNTTSYAGQGQLYSGALQNAQDDATRTYNVGYDQLAKQYQGSVGQANLDLTSALNQSQNNVSSANLAALLAALKGSS